MNIGNAVKILRKNKRISQKELAKLCDISANALCSIEQGESFPEKNTIIRICKALEIPESYLLLFSISALLFVKCGCNVMSCLSSNRD